MMEPGLSLLLLWSLWSTTGLGLDDFASNGDSLNSREQSDGENNPLAVRWVVAGRNDEARLPSFTATPVLPTVASPTSFRLQIRQTTTDPDERPPPPTPPPGPPPAQVESISNSVSASVSSSVAASVTSVFSSSLQALSAASSSAVASARVSGIAEGMSSAMAGVNAPASGTTGSTSATSATGTDAANAIANIQTSASKAVEEAQASASSSAQSAVAEAQASASAVTANANPQSQGSSLTPAQIGGIVISIAFISSLLSALVTFLLMRRKTRQQQETPNKYDPDSLYAPRTRDLVLPPVPEPRPHSLSQSIRNRLSSFHAMFGAPIMPPYRRSQSPSNNNSNAFAADIKRRPPTAEHPAIAMSYNARPLSDPVFPVSPVSSVGGQSLILQGNSEPEVRLQPSPPVPVIVEAAPSPVTVAETSTSARVSLARQQSISGGQRPHLVRVGSGRERSGAGSHPLSMHPVCGDEGYDAAPVSATGQCHIVFPIRSSSMEGHEHEHEHVGWRTSVGTEVSSAPSFQVQAPVPRRLVDPISLERGPNYLPHAY